MRSWKIGTLIAVAAGLAALLLGAFGLGMAVGTGGGAGEQTAPDETKYWFLAIPALAALGGVTSSWNPPVAAVLLGVAAAAVVFLFGFGIVPLVIAAALALAAFLAWMEV